MQRLLRFLKLVRVTRATSDSWTQHVRGAWSASKVVNFRPLTKEEQDSAWSKFSTLEEMRLDDLPLSDKEAYRRDAEAIASDWKAVGDDLRAAMKQIEESPEYQEALKKKREREQ